MATGRENIRMYVYKRMSTYVIAILLMVAAFLGKNVEAQNGTQTYRCVGVIGGVQSTATLQVEPGGSWGGPYVSGQIRNRVAAYAFTGELFGGTEGFVSMVEKSTGERIDRVWIGVSRAGFVLVPEGGPRYAFECQM
jgi:hypothetical protein